jgi:hypothetical protein
LQVRAATAPITEGVYEFPDALRPGQTYVGQSDELGARLETHVASGRLKSINDATVQEVKGGKFAREIAEQTRIDELGGIRGGGLSNLRNPIGAKRLPQAKTAGYSPKNR